MSTRSILGNNRDHLPERQSVFLRVMEGYRERRMSHIKQALAQPSLRKVIAGLIHGTAKFLSTPDNPRGCLSIQGALACGTDAEPVKQAIIDWRKSGEAALKKRLQQAQSEGELPREIHPPDFVGQSSFNFFSLYCAIRASDVCRLRSAISLRTAG